MHAREKMFPRNMQAIAWEAAGRACITLGRQCLLTVQNHVRRVIRWCLWCDPVLSFGCLWNTSGAGVGSTMGCFCGDPGMTPRASLPELASALMPGNIKKFRSILFLFQGSCTGQPCLFSAPSPTPMGLRKRRFMRNPARNSVCQARATDQYPLSTPNHKKIALFLEGGC